eukprot:scaffold116068_cov69-Phaeocystis_antarctica.AAC.9
MATGAPRRGHRALSGRRPRATFDDSGRTGAQVESEAGVAACRHVRVELRVRVAVGSWNELAAARDCDDLICCSQLGQLQRVLAQRLAEPQVLLRWARGHGQQLDDWPARAAEVGDARLAQVW